MTLASGRKYVAIPGPSVVPDRVLAAMHRASPNIYHGELHEMLPGLLEGLRKLVGADEAHVAIYIANGHGAWEAAGANMFSRGDRALAAVTGHFGHGWAESQRAIGVEVEVLDFGRRAAVDAARIAEALAADRDRSIRAVLVTHTDTASTVRNDIAAIRAAMDATGHPALLAVDGIASIGCEAFRFREWGVDVLIGASQKGLMMPPGLSFIWFSEKALAASGRADLVTPYWDWRTRCLSSEFYRHFAGTAPAQHLYGLQEALSILFSEGVEKVLARHEALARAVWTAVDTWAREGDIGLNVPLPEARSRAVTSVRIGGGGATRLRDWTERNAGVTLGIGLGMARPEEPTYGDYLRIAHMGHVNAHMTLGVLAVMEAGMQALGIPHGSGALDAAARVVAEAARPAA
ncbi:aminotransferase class V-fold PLP-dependent enzyme [Chelativorans sp.]|uniref:pyridoxal-phosphate-dependent aminotransferase family protein n=1 Tax=Chelativorans sp. TaxID=2203393 RepID=UPI0028114809|nr:aminotransferase class V-fold PLP-dependent enzyme [Chelativorans sp.]